MLLEGELYIAIRKGGTDKVILTRGNISRYTYIEGDTKKNELGIVLEIQLAFIDLIKNCFWLCHAQVLPICLQKS